jgi:N-acetyl-alpha-D-glucosaminyl L-malate synthase BshA
VRVAIVISGYHPRIGGAEVFARALAEYLAAAKHDVHVVTTRSGPELPGREVIGGVTVHRVTVGTARYVSYSAGFWRLTRCLLRLDREGPFDVIHAVSDGLPSLAAETVKKLRGRRVFITIQGGSLSAGFPGGLRGFTARRLAGWALRGADAVHVISRDLAAAAANLGAKDMTVIPNGIDDTVFKPGNRKELRRQHGISPDTRLVVTVARLHPVKGLDTLVRAAGLLAAEVPALSVMIIGEGSERPKLESLISELWLHDRVQLPGAMNPLEVAGYLGMADAFVLPSRREGLGIALLEAMASGVPCVGSDIGGIVDVIEDGTTGLLVPVGDAAALAAALRCLLEDKDLARRFREAGLKKVRDGFLWSTILPRFDALYNDLTTGGTAP